jgi:prevent-host-death family protein
MASVSVSEFRQHIHAMLERVQQGEELVLTRRGHVIAVVGPAREGRETALEQLAELRHQATVGDVVSPVDVGWEADDVGS